MHGVSKRLCYFEWMKWKSIYSFGWLSPVLKYKRVSICPQLLFFSQYHHLIISIDSIILPILPLNIVVALPALSKLRSGGATVQVSSQSKYSLQFGRALICYINRTSVRVSIDIFPSAPGVAHIKEGKRCKGDSICTHQGWAWLLHMSWKWHL